jgi:4-hydroxybenzoate polyprenyltransferase
MLLALLLVLLVLAFAGGFAIHPLLFLVAVIVIVAIYGDRRRVP